MYDDHMMTITKFSHVGAPVTPRNSITQTLFHFINTNIKINPDMLISAFGFFSNWLGTVTLKCYNVIF